MKPFTFDFDFGTCSYSEADLRTPFQHIKRPGQLQNLCPYPIPSLDEIIKDIDNESRNVDKSKFVSDLFECGALAIANTVDLIQKDKREERYKQVMSEYPLSARQALADIFAKLFALLSSCVYDNGRFGDHLGELFMRCDFGNDNKGQFFTPYHISKFMAEITLGEKNPVALTENDGIISICDPCCGGGGMAIAALDVLKNTYNINYARHCFIDCSDIDLRCVHMTYLQLALAGVPAIVRHRNSLTLETWSVWKTPAFFLQYPRFMKYDK